MLDLVFALILSAVAAGLGLRVLRALDSTPEHPVDGLGLALPLGLGLIGLAALGLGEVGWLGVPGLAGVLLIASCTGARSLATWIRGGLGDRPALACPGSWIDLCCAVALLGTLATALTPATDGDALCYHLQVPKVFLADGSVGFDPDLHETIYPLLAEMLDAVGLALRGPVACRLIQWVLGLAFALNVSALARPLLGDRARWAGAVALLVPAVSNGMGAPLNDVALACYGNAAIVALLRYRDRPSRDAAVLVGMLAGMAIGVKYPALVIAGLVGVGVATAHHPRDRRSRVGDLAAFASATALVGGWWYLRAYIHTGNPVYPFFRHVFGGSGLDEVLDPIKRPMAVNPWNILTALAPMTLDPDRFDSVSHQFGPAFLLFLPALFVEPAPRRLRLIVGIGYAFLSICLTQRQSMRFVLAAVGPMAVGVAWLASRWADRPGLPAKVLVAALVAVLGFEAAMAPLRARHGLGVLTGRESAEAYLRRREPTYRVGLWVDDNLPRGARIVGQDHRGFYIPRPYSMELAHRRRTGLGTRGESPGAVAARLRADGYTHLLMCPPEPVSAVEFDPTLSRLLGPWLARRRPLYEEAIADPDGVTRRYAIYDLGSDEVAESGAVAGARR